MNESPKIGDPVIYVDEQGKEHPALATAVWGETRAAINLLWVSSDESRTDQYGRQTERRSSVVHRSGQGAPGNYWKAAA